MAVVLHGSARTTPRVRAELQASKEKAGVLARRYGLSRTTVNKWRSRSSTADAPMGPHDRRSTVLTPSEEAMIVAFRQRTLLPLDDVMGCLRDQIPKLTRSSLHRCLVRHGISRLPTDETMTKRGRFAETKIGYVHTDHCELRHADGKLHMFLAIDRVSKFTFVAFYVKAGKMNAAAFLRNAIETFPYRIHTILTDNGIAFADLPKNRSGPNIAFTGVHIFGCTCAENGITHKPYHPWTNGQAERMNRTIKDATLKVFHYPDLDSLKAHVIAFVAAHNFAKHLKALRWKRPSRPSHTPGQPILQSSGSIHVTSFRDQTVQKCQRLSDALRTVARHRLAQVLDDLPSPRFLPHALGDDLAELATSPQRSRKTKIFPSSGSSFNASCTLQCQPIEAATRIVYQVATQAQTFASREH